MICSQCRSETAGGSVIPARAFMLAVTPACSSLNWLHKCSLAKSCTNRSQVISLTSVCHTTHRSILRTQTIIIDESVLDYIHWNF